ncbi:hypothetical protein [uncultured Pseudokineococcus sp.]|uniref:hypothetical protein n=1 Tax=uncultured Pseudokineococcus sp. TaxID=1642928 RepID=UPI002603CE02|nr:hypothetical protein [uncultured Pseudokineococcus sp.]
MWATLRRRAVSTSAALSWVEPPLTVIWAVPSVVTSTSTTGVVVVGSGIGFLQRGWLVLGR